MPMKDSRMPDSWIADAMRRNPTVKMPDGTIRTCPVRLAFADDLFVPRKNDEGKESYGATLLFPPGADLSVFSAEWHRVCRESHPTRFDAQGQPIGLHWPFHDGREKPEYSGYMPGAQYISVGSQYKPQIVDPALNPIVEQSRVYSGVWAICGLNVYAYKNKKIGAGFGLQTVMIVADDEKLGGAGPDVKKVFAGVQIDANFNPAAAFAGAPPPPSSAPPAMSIMPPAATVYAPPATLDYDPLA